MSQHRRHFEEHGYVIIRNAINEQIRSGLRRATDVLHQGVRDGKWTTRHQTVLEPSVFDRAYIEFLNIAEINQCAEEILASNELIFGGLACLLGAPCDQICKWHRDFPDSHPEVAELLRLPCHAIQYNAAIYDDNSLWIIPGSHKRRSTQAEIQYAQQSDDLAFIHDRAEALALREDLLSGMPGAINVSLNAGDIALYNNQIWHAAEYLQANKRATLHGAFKIEAQVHRFESSRWGLTHNPWLQEPAYLGEPGPFFGPQLARHNVLSCAYAES